MSEPLAAESALYAPEEDRILESKWPPCLCGSALEAHDWLFLTCPGAEGRYRPCKERP